MPGGRIARRTLLLGLAIGAVAGCAAEPVPMPSPTPSFTSTYLTPPPTELAPLTGVEVPAGSLTTPALSAKVDNHWDARPQVGLERTDLVFEELVEGGLTRYVAVWHSDLPEEIGPVRSIRPMDPDIISPLGGIVAYSGGQYRFVQLMRATEVYNAIHGQPDTNDIMFRTRDKIAPHNVLVRARLLVSRHPDLAPPPQQFAFAPDVAASTAVREGFATSAIRLRFGSQSQPSWSWDDAAGVWRRSQSGKPDNDPSGTPYSAVNVIVIRVPVSYGLGVPKTELIGGGEAWVSSGGMTVHATWSKASRTGLIRLVDDTGTVVRLAPGNSWIELVPTSGSAEFVTPPPPPSPSPSPSVAP